MRNAFTVLLVHVGLSIAAQSGVPELHRSSEAGQRMFDERISHGGGTGADLVIIQRLKYLQDLRALIDERIWPGFNDPRYNAPLIYYSDSATYLMDPTPAAIREWNARRIGSREGLALYRTKKGIDPELFRMVTSFTMGDSSAFDDMEPFMHATGVEETRRFHDDVTSTELWATMVLHEYFHAFQFKHPEHLDHFVAEMIGFAEDSLKGMFRSRDWYQAMVGQENGILLEAIGSDDRKEVAGLLSQFLTVRENRRNRLLTEEGIDIETIENGFETMEGTARYIELRLYQTFAELAPDEPLMKADSLYGRDEKFQEYSMESDPWMHRDMGPGYFYVTGLNMVRLFDKWNVPFQNRLFHQGGTSLEDILREFHGSLKE